MERCFQTIRNIKVQNIIWSNTCLARTKSIQSQTEVLNKFLHEMIFNIDFKEHVGKFFSLNSVENLHRIYLKCILKIKFLCTIQELWNLNLWWWNQGIYILIAPLENPSKDELRFSKVSFTDCYAKLRLNDFR